MDRARTLTLGEALSFQRASCVQLGSRLYADVLDGVIADVAAGGVCAGLLAPHAEDPFATALPLRFLGAVHRVVLGGGARGLAAHYPSAGGAPGPTLVADFLAAVEEHRAEIAARIHDGVQTNEVGRSAALAPGYARVADRSGLPLRVLEVGASGGLNLRWDRFWYDTGETRLGDPAGGVRFEGVWEPAGGRLPVLGPVEVVERAGCDRNPLDTTGDEGRLTLRSYLWPDMVERRERLEAAFAVAAAVAAPVDEADAGDWVSDRLAAPVPGVATVVVHSIVWQYVPRPSRDRMRDALRRAGAAATPAAPLAWLRMEPAGEVADLRLTWWPGGDEQVLGTAGYHGVPVRWGARSPRDTV